MKPEVRPKLNLKDRNYVLRSLLSIGLTAPLLNSKKNRTVTS